MDINSYTEPTGPPNTCYALMKISPITIFAVSLLISGCVAPISHTFFVPNPNDGKAVKSSSCGYLKNNENSLERKLGDLSITVTPQYFSDGKLVVNLFLRHPSPVILFNPQKVEVRETTKGVVLEPINTRKSSYGPDRTHPYTFSVTLFFNQSATDTNTLEVSLHQGALSVGDQEITLEPFRFKQETSIDLYYASINC
jgi:hypothetical protein